jgi:ATP adenylyltransferase
VPLDHLWATWRSNYVTGVADSRTTATPDGEAVGLSLFERILAAPGTDAEKYIVWRGEWTFAILNRFPYTAGHLMVLPLRAVADLEALTPEEHTEIFAAVTQAVVALKSAFGCDGVNVGVNLGEAAGGSQSDHLHVHCVPRWVGDANFISVAADTRVLPVSLTEAWEKLVAAWDAAPR